MQADFFEVDRQVALGAIDYSGLEPNSDYVFALVGPGIAARQLCSRSIGMGHRRPTDVSRRNQLSKMRWPDQAVPPINSNANALTAPAEKKR